MKSYITPKELLDKHLMSISNTKDDSYYIFCLSTVDVGSGYTLVQKGVTYYLTEVSEVSSDAKFLNFYPYWSLKRV